MTIGRHEPKYATGTGLKEALHIGLDEAFTALTESIHGLANEEFWAFPLEHRHNIVTLCEHCLQCLDLYGCEVQGRPLTFKPQQRFDIWNYSPQQLRPQMTDLPAVSEELPRIQAVCDNVLAVLDTMPLKMLGEPNMDSWWFQEQPDKVRADAFLRAICHTMTHVRQIWLLRGLQGLTDTTGWPEQHWA